MEISAHTTPSVSIQKSSALVFVLMLYLQPSRSIQMWPWIVASVCLDVLETLDQVMVARKGPGFSGQWSKNLQKATSNWETTLKNNRVRDTVYGEMLLKYMTRWGEKTEPLWWFYGLSEYIPKCHAILTFLWQVNMCNLSPGAMIK